MAAGPLPNDQAPRPDRPEPADSAHALLFKHRRMVTLLRIALPMATLLLAALVIAWPKLQNRAERNGFALTPTHADPREVEQLAMVNPRFVGLDSKQQPYTITATTALQGQAGSDLVLLDRPQADITLQSGAWVTLTARNGRYHQKSQILDLEGDINVFHDAGYQFQTEKAEVDLANDTVTGEEPVTGHGPGGTIDATGFMILDRGGTLVFTGPSKLHLNPGAGKAEPAKPAGKAGGKAR